MLYDFEFGYNKNYLFNFLNRIWVENWRSTGLYCFNSNKL